MNNSSSQFVYCSKCGTRNFSDDNVCGVCNSKLLRENVSIKNKTPFLSKISPGGWVLILIVGVVCYSVLKDEGNKKNPHTKDTVYNNELDASVYQVEDYLKNSYFNDPDSYKPVSWSEVFKLNDIKQTGFACYQVRHKYRAKNGFGGYVTEEKVFKLDYEGNVVDVKDFLR